MVWNLILFSVLAFLPTFCLAQTPAQAGSDPLPIPHPSLQKAGPIVRSHIEEERQRFEAVVRSRPSPSSGHVARAYANLARVYHTYQFEAAALACYLNLDRIQPGIYPCQYAIGWIYHNQGQFDRALPHLIAARNIAQGLQDTPPSVLVAVNCLIGDAHLKLQKLPEAMKAFQEAVALNPGCAYAWHGMGLANSIEGKSNAAIECLERAIQLQPYASAGHVVLAREYQKAGQAEKASNALPALKHQRTIPFAFYDPIIARDVAPLNRSAAAVHTRALAAKHQGNVQLSIDLFHKAIELNPRFTTAKANLASAYLTLNRFDEALRFSRQALDDQPDNASFHDLLGVTLFKQGTFDEALRAFQYAQSLDPDHGTHRYWIGAVLSWQGHHLDALKMFETAAKLSDTDPNPRIGASVMMARLGKPADALDLLRRALRLFPGSAEMKLNLAQCLSAHPDSTPQDGEEARALALPVYDQTKSVPAAISAAMACAAAGDFSTAAEIQRSAIARATEQGYALDLPWLKRNLALYQDRKPSREPWNQDRGYPALEGFRAEEENELTNDE